MRIVDPIAHILWLDAATFGSVLGKTQKTILVWCRNGFIVELGYILEKDATGHYRIGIRPEHNSYQQFYLWTDPSISKPSNPVPLPQ